jgi:hypothetical protein
LIQWTDVSLGSILKWDFQFIRRDHFHIAIVWAVGFCRMVSVQFWKKIMIYYLCKRHAQITVVIAKGKDMDVNMEGGR